MEDSSAITMIDPKKIFENPCDRKSENCTVVMLIVEHKKVTGHGGLGQQKQDIK